MAPAAGTHGLAWSVGLAATIFVGYLLLPQQRLHGDDSDHFVRMLQSGDIWSYHRHFAFLPLVWLVWSLLQPLGLGAYQALLVTAAAGSAGGVFALHRAAQRLAPRGVHAGEVSVACALVPGVFFYATSAEIHGPFFGAVGAAWWAFARWQTAPSARWALGLGAACGVATAMHSFGCLLPPMFVVTAVLLRVPTRGSRLAQLTALAGAWLVVLGGLALCLDGGAGGQARGAWSFLRAWCEPIVPGAVVELVWTEWLLPYLPWSVLAWLGLAVARSRTWSLVCVSGLLLHAPMTVLLLARRGPTEEMGAYLLPMTLPAVLAAAALLSRRALWLAITCSGAVALTLVAPNWRPLGSPDFVTGVQQLQTERTFSLLVDQAELEGVRMHCSGIVCTEVTGSFEAFLTSVSPGPAAPSLENWFDACVATLAALHAPMLITDAAQQAILTSPYAEVRELWRVHVPHTYDLQPIRRAGLHGVLLSAR